jgi:hypothetical protein
LGEFDFTESFTTTERSENGFGNATGQPIPA